MEHKSVLKKEIIDLLQIKPEGSYVDLTLGGGGHSLEIAKSLKNGTLISFDVDATAITNYESSSFAKASEDKQINKKFKKFNENINILKTDNRKLITANENFENLVEVLKQFNIEKVDGIIADLGWSTDQLESIKGLSFEKTEEDLDMRLDQKLGVKASDLLNVLGKKQLKKMFESYADIKGKLNAYLVEEIIQRRNAKLFEKVEDILPIVEEAGWKSNVQIQNAMKFKAQVFQALRIAVNNEFSSLKNVLESSLEVLKNDGRLLVITFHSGEEKIVSEIFNQMIVDKKAEFITHQRGHNYIQASVEELMDNISSRSAKLFGIKKT